MIKIKSSTPQFFGEGFSYTNQNSIAKLIITKELTDSLEIQHDSKSISEFEVRVNEDASMELIEVISGRHSSLSFTFKCVCEGKMKHVRFSHGKCKNIVINSEIVVDSNGSYDYSCIDLNQGSAKLETKVVLAKPDVVSNMYSAVICDEENSKNYCNTMVNQATRTKAYMENYGVSFEKGTLQIKGIGDIKKNAKAASSRQKSTMFVLDPQAKAVSEPYLYIDEDDVEASHATAVGQVNDETIFYLCSRGLSKESAKKMVVLGYFNPIVDRINDSAFRREVYKQIQGVIEHD